MIRRHRSLWRVWLRQETGCLWNCLGCHGLICDWDWVLCERGMIWFPRGNCENFTIAPWWFSGGRKSCWHLYKTTSQSTQCDSPSPCRPLIQEEGRFGEATSKAEPASFCAFSAVNCYKLLFASDSCFCLPRSAQQSDDSPDSLLCLPDDTWVDGCIFRLNTSQQRSFSLTPTCQKPWDLFMPLLALAAHHFRLS